MQYGNVGSSQYVNNGPQPTVIGTVQGKEHYRNKAIRRGGGLGGLNAQWDRYRANNACCKCQTPSCRPFKATCKAAQNNKVEAADERNSDEDSEN